MRNSETHKKQVNIFGLGASYDLAPELSSMAKQGFYKDSQNMRLSNTNQLDFSLDRIKGEEVRYGNGTYSGAYTCIGVAEVNYHPVEVWCADDNSDVYFRIDGELMLCDIGNKMKLSTSHPLQVHKNDSCNGGEFYFTDNVNPPYIYSIQDIIDKHLAGSQLYKNDFNPLLYQTLLTQPINAPVFIELVSAIGAGLPAGEYSYSFRYVDDSGNRTLFSPPTPLIPVIASQEKGSDYYAYSKTYGANTVAANTDFNPKIQFRVDNRLNYKYIEIGRIAWNENQAVGYVPIKQYYQIARELLDGEFGVWEFTDDPTKTWIDITDADTADQMGAIETAKAIRYFNGQLVLGNITYASRDLDGVVTFKKDDGELAHPFIDDIGVRAYSDPWNSTYKKQYMSGERYGYGVACYDSLGNISLVLPIDDGVIDLKNYQFPNRRERVSSRTLDLSENNWKGIPRAADINNNPGVAVHERMQFKPPYNHKTGSDFKSISSSAPYSVLHPTKYNDTYADHNYRINTEVCLLYQANGNPFILSHDYEPYTFSPNIYAQALAIAGLDEYPDWVSAFSIVRTKPAGRVVTQGLSMYSLLDTYQDKGDIISDGYNLINKIKDRSWFFSDDVNNGYAAISDSNSVQFVSPVGYFSEVYSNEYEKTIFGHPYCKNCDMIVYADQFYTDPYSTQSPDLRHHTDAGAYWTKFGEWRYDHGASSPFAGSDGNKIFPLSGAYSDTFKGSSSARSLYNILTYDTGYNVYVQDTAQSFGLNDILDVNNVNTQAWHEPFYIANIVNDGKNVPDNNINEYILTGHFQKIISKIGIGTGTPQSIRLVDERWQDCMVNYYSATRESDNVFVRIDDRYWLDITYKNAVDRAAIISDLTNSGVHILNDVYVVGDSISVTGVYTSTFDSDYDRDFYINFDVIPSLDNYYTIPSETTEIIVRYDNRFPLIVYGGDTVIGRTVFAPVDGESDGGGNVVDQNQLFSWVGFPYPAYKFNPNYYVLADSGVGMPQVESTIPINIIRQMLVMFYAESRSHLPFYHSELSSDTDDCDPSNYNGNNFFPQVHYVMRPIKWNTDCVENFDDHGGHVSSSYKNDYPGEFFYWGMGGFRINPSTASMNNRDYSQWNSFNTEFSKPQVGFTEKTRFCSRVIWSVKRNINEQNDPNLKTFLSLNAYDINDANQEIKFLYDNDSDKGNNLLALTGNGVCLLLTEKKLISQATGNDLTYLDADKLVSGEYWLSKTIGCSNEMWRGCAEYDNQLFFPNSESVYRLSGLKIDDIGRNNNGSYFSKLNPVLQSIDTGFTDSACAVYDVKHSEYWLHLRKNYDTNISVKKVFNLGNPISDSSIMNYTVSVNEHIHATYGYPWFDLIMPTSGFNVGDVFYITPIGTGCHVRFGYTTPVVSVFSPGETYCCEFLGGNSKPQWRFEQVDYIRNNGYTYVYNNDIQKQTWTGYNTYFADKMLNVYGNTQKDLGVLLMRDFNTYDTNVGDYINGDPVNGAVSFYVASDPYATKEFIDQTFNCNQAPTYCDYSNYNNTIPEATQVHFKNYTQGYYTQIPRKQDLDRYRFQGKYLWCNVGCDSLGDWNLSMVESGYKVIR